MGLDEELAALPPPLLAHLARRGFDPERLKRFAAALGEKDRDARNRLSGTVEPPLPGDVADAPREGTPEHARCTALGLEALRRGEVALCVLAGGMATRMGGVVKALVEALPPGAAGPGKTFLALRLAENEHLERAFGARVPLWLMTSEATEGPIREALASRAHHPPGDTGRRLDDGVATFEQQVSLRLTPEGGLFLGDDGQPEAYATGHGDLPDALRASGLLSRFVAAGGKTVWIANLDNLGATVDPALLGWHLEQKSPLTVELAGKAPGDKGGGPVRWNGRPIITEEFRLPVGFDQSRVPVFNTNTFLADARALDALRMEWTWVVVEKKVGQRKAIQLERLLGEITAALDTRMLRISREGALSRFLPVKDVPELERRRPEIEAVARARGFLSTVASDGSGPSTHASDGSGPSTHASDGSGPSTP